MDRQGIARWLGGGVVASLLGLSGVAAAQTTLQASVAGSVAATDNAQAMQAQTEEPIEAIYFVGSGRLALAHAGTRASGGLSYLFSAYHYVDVPQLHDTVSHTVDAFNNFDLSRDQQLAFGASFTKGQLNALVPFALGPGATLPPGVVGPGGAMMPTPLPDAGQLPTNEPRFVLVRPQGAINYIGISARQTWTAQIEKWYLRQGLAGTHFRPLTESALRANAWAGDLGFRAQRMLPHGYSGLFNFRLGQTWAEAVVREGQTLFPRNSTRFTELLVGARRDFSASVWAEAGVGLYGTFVRNRTYPSLGPAAQATVAYVGDIASASAQYLHTVTGSVFLGQTFTTDAVYLNGALALGALRNVQLFATGGLQQGRRRSSEGPVPGELVVVTGQAGAAYDPRGPFRFSVRASAITQVNRTGPNNDALMEQRLTQNLVLATMEVFYPWGY
jgi:hypothetical protein